MVHVLPMLTVDSTTVLWGQTVIYTAYALVIISLMGWFALNVTRPGSGSGVAAKAFYTWVGFLAVLGVSLHLITYNTIPWSPVDLNRDAHTADKTFEITVADHEFTLPSDVLAIECNDLVMFSVESADLTYGFGLFRPDDSMVFQMQVVPGHPNEVLWQFQENGTYTIRSTEYSGPEGAHMILPDSVQVTGCETG